MGKKPSVEALEALHVLLTEAWAARLKEAKDDDTGTKALAAAELTALAKFLKDNNVTAVIRASPVGADLMASLPFEIEAENEQ